ncbi:hypothetical protein [Shewanella glacialipiscicola]|uniref:Uncharacterized protein n=1 Tax=Shewanella glacialipiscicola TaxID=614069 RepID=A0ABQ6J4N5_9GAMM|nr:hypothetical protein [Shewanella glacialipiscicola]GMA82204.1 hypothetical protein GCM10025855_17370 [Shewanella glacialipiscicola]
MSVIRSVAAQWNKAEFAHKLEIYLSQDSAINDFFVGVTNRTTLCTLIAAMVELPAEINNKDFKIDQNQVFDYFFQCFYLLFIKEIEHHTLTQAEQLILSIAVYFANKINKQKSCSDITHIQKSSYIITAMSRLESIRKKTVHHAKIWGVIKSVSCLARNIGFQLNFVASHNDSVQACKP